MNLPSSSCHLQKQSKRHCWQFARGILTTREDLESGGLIDRTRGVPEVEPERGAYNCMYSFRHGNGSVVDEALTNWLVGYPGERRRIGIASEILNSRRAGGVARRQARNDLGR